MSSKKKADQQNGHSAIPKFPYDLENFRRKHNGTFELVKVRKDKKDVLEERRIASHAVRISKVLFVIFNRHVEVRYLLRFYTGNGAIEVVVRHADLNEERAFLNAAPPGFAFASAHRAFHKVREMLMLDLSEAKNAYRAKHVAVLTALGWYRWKGEPVFAHAGGIISSDMDLSDVAANAACGTPEVYRLQDIDEVCSNVPILSQGKVSIEEVRVELPDQFAKYRFERPVSKTEIQTVVRQSLELLELGDSNVTYVSLAAIFYVSLRNPRFALFLRGESGSLKTAFAMILLSFFVDRPEEADLANFKSTENALRARFTSSGNVPVVIDDFIEPPGTRSNSAIAEKADNTIRGIVNGNPKERAAQDGSLRPNDRPRGLAIVTGEVFPAALESLKKRTVIVQVDNTCFETAVSGPRPNQFSAIQELAETGIYRKAMAAFIAWAANNYDVIQRYLDDPGFIPAAEDKLHLRLPDIANALLAGMVAFLGFARAVRAISKDEAERQIEACSSAIETMLERAYLESLEDRPTEAFSQLLQASLASQTCHIEVVDLDDYLELSEEGGTIPLDLLGYSEHQVEISETPQKQNQGQDGSKGQDETQKQDVDDSKKESPSENESDDESENEFTTKTVYRPHGKRIGWLHGERIDLIPEAALAAANSMAVRSGASPLPNKKSFGKMLASHDWIAQKNRDRNTCKVRHGDAVIDVWRIHAWRLFELALPWGDFDVEYYKDMTAAERQKAYQKHRDDLRRKFREKLARFQADALLNPHLTEEDRRELLCPEPPEEDEIPNTEGRSRRYKPAPPPSSPEPWEGDGLLA